MQCDHPEYDIACHDVTIEQNSYITSAFYITNELYDYAKKHGIGGISDLIDAVESDPDLVADGGLPKLLDLLNTGLPTSAAVKAARIEFPYRAKRI